MKLTDWHYIVIRSIVILNYVKKSSQSKYKKKFCILLLFGHIQILGTLCSYTVIQTYESKVCNCIISLNSVKERTSIKFNLLKMNSPFTTYFGKSQHMTFPLR